MYVHEKQQNKTKQIKKTKHLYISYDIRRNNQKTTGEKNNELL